MAFRSFKCQTPATQLHAVVVGLLIALSWASAANGQAAAADMASVYFVDLSDGETVPETFAIRFGLKGMGLAPAGVEREGTGHHHLLIDTELPPPDLPIPNDANHLHFGTGLTETELTLPPGEHTLQLLLGDHEHVPFDPPVVSEKIRVVVEPQAGEAPSVYFVDLEDGDTVTETFPVRFGLKNMGLAPAGVEREGTGHHHLLIDTELPPPDLPIPNDANHLHFGTGLTETELTLPPGEHTLQLLLGDYEHVPFDPPVVSGKIRIIVEPEGAAPASAYFIDLKNGDTVPETFPVRFGLKGMGLAPAGVEREGTGHHHLLIDTELPPPDLPIPNDANHLHFGTGLTETELTLPPGEHTLQLLLGDHEHVPFDPPVVSDKIRIIVEPEGAEPASVYFIDLENGATVPETFPVRFGLEGMGLAPAGVEREGTGHHHLLIDTELPPPDLPIPNDANHLHFGTGLTETELTLAPGQHTLQLLLGDDEHVPFDPPIVSERIRITVEPGLADAPSVYFLDLEDGAKVPETFPVRFGLKGMGLAPAGVEREGTGHHHLLIDTDLPPLDLPIPNDANHLHFGTGLTETELTLPPGEHTLQLLVGDHEHVPGDPPVVSERIRVTVSGAAEPTVATRSQGPAEQADAAAELPPELESVAGDLAVTGHARTPAPPDAAVYFVYPKDGMIIHPVSTIRFGLTGMGVAPAGVDKANTGHHHLIIDDASVLDLNAPIPNDANHLHFGGGQTQVKLSLSPGEHTLQLVLADANHVPHDPPVASERITILVRPGGP